MRWVLADNKNYQKTQSRTASKASSKQINIARQTIKYLVTDPLAVNYILRQESTSTGTNHAEQSYNY